MRVRLLLCFILLCAHGSNLFAAAVPVKIQKVSGGWQLLRDGKPYYANGAAGAGHLDLLKKLGGNSVRTWSVHELETTSLLKDANHLNLTVAAGLTMEPPRHGFNYADAAAVNAQHHRAIAAVEKFKNEAAILVWGIGNEMEGDGADPAIWKAVNDIAREIHRIDPNHPTMTVIAGAGENNIKLINFMKYCPDVDILGINSYGGMATVLEDVTSTKLDRPYFVTEFGPLGWWERAKTSWGAPLEQTSTEKAATYRQSYEHSIRDAGKKCLGSYVFLWGWKQERTHTWFNMLLIGGLDNAPPDKTAMADVISYEWTGHWPANRAPEIFPISTPAAEKEIAPGQEVTAEVKATDPENDKLTYAWQVREETSDPREGGDAEAVPPVVPGAVLQQAGPHITFRTPQKSGAYRLFVEVRDGKGSVATANVPFFVKKG
jgi:hypothetical protein